ncbi:AbrB/MazE/SpoVT family DNA-binding domain-containing protein [Cohnella herbarum]|uniref:AbrB/MazE/SpoVT family DNA-binding domain-containing protein n=1 Tax=Cohnella herbarum TaxID=2728023 RepID=A0A7Z2ZPT7_9BACL|nr:AbrB/MazE/SpoVT family DNA-binding domain-containing protein [Cohnella herbarum]QJD86302.1 AbrB/MazE/SpoVT family DNA-binding domain-containing protein [Cohnella herbarum]
MAIADEVVKHVEWKRARVSKQRQVTIPLKFFEQVGIKDEVEVGLQGQNIIIRPIRQSTGSDHFAEQILAELIANGCPQEELLEKFRERQTEIRHAAKDLLAEAQVAARQFKGTGDEQMKELFGDVMGG